MIGDQHHLDTVEPAGQIKPAVGVQHLGLHAGHQVRTAATQRGHLGDVVAKPARIRADMVGQADSPQAGRACGLDILGEGARAVRERRVNMPVFVQRHGQHHAATRLISAISTTRSSRNLTIARATTWAGSRSPSS